MRRSVLCALSFGLAFVLGFMGALLAQYSAANVTFFPAVQLFVPLVVLGVACLPSFILLRPTGFASAFRVAVVLQVVVTLGAITASKPSSVEAALNTAAYFFTLFRY